MIKVIMHPLAYNDIHEIWCYTANDSEKRADAVYDGFEQKLQTLAEYPKMGRARQELGDNLRSVTFGKYVIFYRIKRNVVEIIRVLHGSRDLDGLFNPEE
jgi:toxin ParE1/3/4